MTKYSLHFRNTAGAYGEVAPSGAILGDLYPASIAGLTVGWSGSTTRSDAGATGDARLSGRNLSGSDGITFRVDLPDGPGTYRIWLALSALSTTVTTGCRIFDGPTTGALLATVPSTSVATANVMDASGAVLTTSAWLVGGGTPVDVVATGSYLTFARVPGVSFYINCLEIEYQPAPLVDCVLFKEDGTGVNTRTIWAKEPPRHQIGKVSSSIGLQNFSIVAGGTYFAIEARDGFSWVVTTATRIPDGWTGNLTIRQTAGGSTRDTTFAMTATAITRPLTGYLGLVTSETIFRRQRIRTVIDGELWAGYTGQSFASDQTANSPSDLTTKANAITPDGTSWYRIRLQNGTWTGSGFNFSQKDFGAGGLLIESDTGHDPLIECEFRNALMRKCHVRGLKVAPWSTGTGKYNFTAGIPASAPYPLWRFSGMRLGAYYAPGFSIATAENWSDFCSFEFVEQVAVHDCDFIGMANCIVISGGRIMSMVGNRHRLVRNDFHALSTAFRFNTPRGVFADDLTYAEMRECTAWHNPDDYTGLPTNLTPHGDWFQNRRTTGGVTGAYPTLSAGINGSPVTPWVVGYIGFNPAENRLYDVVAVTGDALLDVNAQPTGTGTGIVSGNVTFNYRQDYNLGTTMRVHLEGNCIHQDGLTVNLPGNAFPNVQFVINSNSGWNNILDVVAINNLCASGNTRGIIASGSLPDSDVSAELNSFVGGAQKPLPNDQPIISGGTVRAARNFVGEAAGGLPNVEALGSVMSELNVIANFKADAVAPKRPGDVMRGSFSFDAANGWGYSLTDDDTVTAAEFRSNLSKQMHHTTGDAGAKLREVHTITLTGSNGTEQVELVITP